MSRWLLTAVFFFSTVALTASCTGDRCRIYGTWMSDRSTSSPFVYPHPALIENDRETLTGVRANLPIGYRTGILFPSAFERLNGLGTTSPFLLSDDFLGTYFSDADEVSIDVVEAESLKSVELEPLPRPPGGLKGALPKMPLKADTEYWMTVSGKPSFIDCGGAKILPLTDDDEKADEVLRRLSAVETPGPRTVVLPFQTQSIDGGLRKAAALAAESDVPRVESTRAYVPVDADGKLNRALFEQFPPLIRGIRYGQRPHMSFDNVAHIVMGKLSSLEFREDRRLSPDKPASSGIRELEFLLVLPKTPFGEKLPAPGTSDIPRLVIFSHPLRACKEAALGLADTLAAYGFAVAAIDHVEHGTRQSAKPDDYVCGESIPWTFFAGGDPEQLRDNVLVSALDLYQLKLALERAAGADWNGDGRPDYLTDRIGVVAMSLGSIIATPMVSLSSNVDAVVLNTALGTTIELIDQHLPETSKYALPFPGSVPSLNLAVAQAILDAGEPINYARRLRKPNRSLLVQQAVDDPVVPNSSTGKFARALDLVMVKPVHREVADLRTVTAPYTAEDLYALYQVDNVNHSFLLIPRDEAVLEPARRQVAHFLWSHFALGKATVLPIER